MAGKPGLGSSAERWSGTDGLIGMCVARPSAWADARSDARRLPLAAPGLLVAQAAAPAAAGGDGSAGGRRARPARPDETQAWPRAELVLTKDRLRHDRLI